MSHNRLIQSVVAQFPTIDADLLERTTYIYRIDSAKATAMRVSKRGQVTIPKPLRDRFGLKSNVEVVFIPTERGSLLRKKTEGEHPVDRLVGTLIDFEFDSTDEFIDAIRGR